MDEEFRARGKWRETPWFLRLIGRPKYCRSVYADWRIGGGWDGLEYSNVPPVPADTEAA